jgi:rhodanese-related sulfurtransferase
MWLSIHFTFILRTQRFYEFYQDSYIIDVREKEEVMQGMIPGAVNLPLSVLSNALHLPRHSFFEKFGFEKPKVDQEVVFYCRSGVRSATAADVAKRNGYDTKK